MWCTQIAENTGRKNRQEIAIWGPSHNFVHLLSSQVKIVSTIGKTWEYSYFQKVIKARGLFLRNVWKCLILILMLNILHCDVQWHRRLKKFYIVNFIMYVSSNVLATRKWHCPVLAIYSTQATAAVLPVLAMFLLYHLDVDWWINKWNETKWSSTLF